jgi:predicted transcriptional regulator
MKAVLMSIQPRWCELIASGKKTVEVRKTRPKLETPFKCYIYCTKGETVYHPRDIFGNEALNGKVIGEFVCDRISGGSGEYAVDHTEGTCLTPTEIADYIGDKYAYYWHITNLVIYDKPRELRSFFKPRTAEELEADIAVAVLTCGIHGSPYTIKKPPQSWCYVEEA